VALVDRSPPSIEASVVSLRADVVSGAAVVARAATRIVERVSLRLPAQDVEGFRAGIEELVLRILDAQPSMAPLVALGASVLRAVEPPGSLPELRGRVTAAAAAVREGLERDTGAAAHQAALALPEEGRILTLSSSSTVRSTLIGLRERKGCEVICLESRPMNEGRAMARALADAGVRVTLAVDAAGDLLARGADAVLMGADSVGDLGIVNKIGSRAVATAAREAGVPVFVVTDQSKFLPPGVPQPPATDRPAEEVGRPAPGVRVWNRYFEILPLPLVSAVITGAGPLPAARVREIREALTLPDALERWFREREAVSPARGR
jgi:translation initiation factor eIF-2B subunit delta